MLVVFVRAIILYIILLVIMRLMGKRQLSELQPFEFVITLIIAELAAIPMSEIQIPIMFGIIPLFTLFVLHLFITKIASKSIKFNKYLNGKPIIVITPQGIDKRVLDQLDMNVTDLLHALRASGYFYPSEVAYAILETNGKLSVLPKAEAAPLTAKTTGDQVPPAQLPYPIICDGVLEYQNMEVIGIEENKVNDLLNQNKLKINEVLLLTIDRDKEVFLQPKKGNAINASIQ